MELNTTSNSSRSWSAFNILRTQESNNLFYFTFQNIILRIFSLSNEPQRETFLPLESKKDYSNPDYGSLISIQYENFRNWSVSLTLIFETTVLQCAPVEGKNYFPHIFLETGKYRNYLKKLLCGWWDGACIFFTSNFK